MINSYKAKLFVCLDVVSKAFGGDAKMVQESSFIHTGIKDTRIQDKESDKFHYVLGSE